MSPKQITKPLDVYVRVSRVGGREGDSFISPKEQEQRCRALAEARGYKVGKVFTDLDRSGGRMERPEFEKALARIKDGVSAGLLVARIDRFARTLVGGLQTLEQIQEAGGVVLTAEGDFDTSTNTGELVLNLMLSLAQFELRRIRENWAAAKRNAVERGVHIASRVPLGYRRTVKGYDKKGKPIQGPLEIDPETTTYVAEVFRRRAAGASWKQLAEYLEEHSVLTPTLGDGKGKTGGGNRWSMSAIRKLIQNPIYKGEPRGGAPVEAIVTRREWSAAQSAPGVTTRTPDGALLAGLCYCGSCGRRMAPDKATKGNGERVRFYRCRPRAAQATREPCPHPATIVGNLIEPFVVAAALEHLTTLAVQKHRDEPAATKAADIEQALADLDAEEAEIEAEHEAGEITEKVYRRALSDVERKRDDLEAKLAEVATPAGEPEWVTLRPAKVRELLFEEVEGGILGDKIQLVPRHVPTVRAFLGDVIEKATVKAGRGPVEDRVEIEYGGPLAA